MRSKFRAIAIRALSIGVARNAAPRLASALLVLAGVLLAIMLPVAAVQSAVPLGPFLMWFNWMALFSTAAVAVVAVRRVRRLEAGLQGERRRFRALAEAVPAGVCQFGPAGELMFSNNACEALFGGVPQTCGNGPAFRGLHPDDRARLRDRWEAARFDRRAFAEEFRLSADGAERWVTLNAVPVADGCRQGYVCCLAEGAAARRGAPPPDRHPPH
ncbi:PAS domain S-box protein [Azospirillum sp. sgz301742]